MKFRISSLLTSLVAVLASMQVASAASLVVGVSDNTTIRLDTTNQGSSELLFAGDTTSTTNGLMRSVLAFDLSNPVLTGATINSATLTFTVRNTDNGENATMTLNLHELTSSFTNGGATWTSRDGTNDWTTPGGDFNASVLASFTGNPTTVSPGDEVDFSGSGLTTAVEDSIGGTLNLLMKSATENHTTQNLFRFASTRNTLGNPDYPGPVLTIDYTPIPEPSAALLGGLGLLALLHRRRKG